ncbi:MAG: glycosyltransferase [Bacteroidetes bacterium]|nr:glycosyltransferase [Bacteroidota bacterium]
MDLSIIIVNYNVKYFLEQCLHSVQQAMEGIDGEVFVVDNNSVDGSVGEIRTKFPGVKLIANRDNVGFSKANNQAIRESTGKYALLLNPDTVVEENTFRRCIAFMDEHPDAGAMGVKMIDGKGEFLPESKRSLPTPMVSFYKMFGLSSLFPSSKRFGKYHLGYLDKEETHQVDVLAGAFMFMRMEVLDLTGLLDETFFMYGEDIDLSYRITQAGYKNYYYPGTTIIHYKGESTKKGSLNYVKMFYQAMIIFAGKHFTARKARTFSILINLAIYFRAALSVGRRFIKKTYRPVLDAALIFLGYLFALPFWEQVRFDITGYYPPLFLRVVVPAYILVWLVSLYYSGGYDKPVKPLAFLRGHLAGTLVIMVIYAMLPLDWRFSRALIFMGSLWAILSTMGLRIALHLSGIGDYEIDLNKQKRMVIVGKGEEAKRVSDLLLDTQAKPDIIGYVSPTPLESETGTLGHIEQIDEIMAIHKINEIVFCAKDLSSRVIIGIMTRLIGTSTDFKIAPPESLSIIGSNSINTAGDLYTIHFNSIGKESNRRNKRLFDVIVSLLLLITFPFWILFTKGKFRSLAKLFRVLTGSRTWVGYLDPEGLDMTGLPGLKKGILNPSSHHKENNPDPDRIKEINVVYAKDYRVFNDLLIITRSFREI